MARASVLFGMASLTASLIASGVHADICSEAAADTGFQVARLWPLDCSVAVPIDAPIYLDGGAAHDGAEAEGATLVVRLIALGRDGADATEVKGDLEFTKDGHAALFRPREELAPHRTYRVLAMRVDGSGDACGTSLEHTFVTGDAPLPPIELRGELEVTSRTGEATEQRCTYDACGARKCSEGDRRVGRHIVSVYVPRITGGLPAVQGDLFAQPYEVVVRFAEEGAKTRGAHLFASARRLVAPDKAAMIEVAVPQLGEPFVGCAEVTISDLTGTTLELPKHCIELSPPEADPTPVAQAVSSAASEDDAPLMMADGAAHCGLGKPKVGTLMWYCAVALLLLLIARRRFFPF